MNQRAVNERGITLVELMVAMTLNSFVFAMVLSAALSNRQLYLEDIVRVRIASNLRTSADIVSMNVKQVGENLSSSFPALTLENGVGTESDILTIRRGVLNEVLSLCQQAVSASSRLYVSYSASDEAACKDAAISSLHANFESFRSENSDNARLYIFDSVNQTGEFLDFESSGNSSAEYYFDVSSLSQTYEPITSFIFVIEEFKFAHSDTNNSLVMYRDGNVDDPQSVAFSVDSLSVILKMKDGPDLHSLGSMDPKNWKDVELVNIELIGKEEKFNKIITYSHNQDIFPRNIMSVYNSTNVI